MDTTNSKNKQPLVSIITVCFNAEKTISKTIESVLNQTERDYEYLLIDGQSADNTVSIINIYKNAFENKKIRYVINSEPDQGIYDAMNKGVELASGKWILFLNADDSLSNDNVLGTFKRFETSVEAEVIYGDSVRIKKNSSKLDVADKRISELLKSKFFCHQAAFTKADICKKYPFDNSFHVCGDYDFFLRIYLDNGRFAHLNTIVCNYSVEGTSNQHYYKTILENYKVRVKNGIDKYSFLLYVKAFIWNIKHVINGEW